MGCRWTRWRLPCAGKKIAACVLTANFPNPTGSLMSDAAKRRTVDLLAQHGVPLIEDDSVGELYYGKARPLPFKAFDQTGNVYYCATWGFWWGRAFRWLCRYR